MRIRIVAEVLGGMSSAICAVHCLAGPLVLFGGPLLQSVLLPDRAFHEAMIWFVVPASTVAFALGCRRHGDPWTLTLAVAGLLGLLVAATSLHDVVGESGERIATLLAASALVGAHVRNFRLCRAEECDHGP